MLFCILFDCVKRGTSRLRGQKPARGISHRRCAPCRLTVESLDERLVPASLSVGDAMVVEGNAGIQYAEVIASLSQPSAKTVTVRYHTADGTATAGSDYDAVSGKLSFVPGQTSKSILLPVRGDRLPEPDENFFVKLNAAKNAKIAVGTGVVTNLDDELRISIDNTAAYEGNSGTTLMTFTVTLSATHNEAVTVSYATADGTATIANNDYIAAWGTLTFALGETSKKITVEIVGDTNPEGEAEFFVNLSGASLNAFILDSQGFGRIMDDDGWIPPPEPCTDCNTF